MSQARPNLETDKPIVWRDRLLVAKVFAALAVVTLLLRIFYSTHLYQDDGLWFTTAQEMLRGKALYREIYFDKPPLLPLMYAGLFRLFGAHILTIRLFTVFYSLGIAALLYRFGAWLYGERAGLTSAAVFTVFSTTFTTGHVQGLNTDFLMVLPYTAAAFLFVRARGDFFGAGADGIRGPWAALAGGVLTGIGAQINPKALVNLIFLALLLFVARKFNHEGKSKAGGWTLLAIAFTGVAAGTAPFLLWLSASSSLANYWTYVWIWGGRYAAYYPAADAVRNAISQTGYYFLVNPLLLLCVLIVARDLLIRKHRIAENPQEQSRGPLDVAILLWLVVSYVGLAIGGRFFGHYFFQLMPALSLLAGRALVKTMSWGLPVKTAPRRAMFAAIAALFLFSVVRFHVRTVTLAADLVRGKKSLATAEWFHDRLNEEEKSCASFINQPAADNESSGLSDSEAEEDNYLFVWGYRPEIYFWSGFRPASQFLSSQPLTGVPADVHYSGGNYKPVLTDAQTATDRVVLAAELDRVRPRFIVDELGFFNSALAIENYPELEQLLTAYRPIGSVGRFLVLARKDTRRHYRKRHGLE